MPLVRGLPRQTGVGGGVAGGVKVLGIPELISSLGKVSTVARLRLGAVVAGGAIHMKALAVGYCPAVTGNLRSGIKLAKGAGPYTYEVTASSLDGDIAEKNKKEYAGFVENGWTGHPQGAFFMRRAFQETHPIILAELAAVAAELRRL